MDPRTPLSNVTNTHNSALPRCGARRQRNGRLAINTNTSGVVRIKNLEVDRLVVCTNKNNKGNANDLISDDERKERLQEALNHAGGFLNESLFDAENDHILDLSPISRKKKFNNAKKQKTGNLPKKPKTPSKIIIK
jgi:NADPH:quinone reductase-like Zn-dependent oxidoreductase